MARKKITKERVLLTLTEAKKSMDKSEFNSYSFRMQYPEWGQFGCILKKNGVFKKQNQKYFWLSIEPNINMVDKLLEIYYKKQSINRSNHLEKLSQKKSVIVEEKDVKSTSDLSFDYAEPKTTDSTLSSIMPYESFEIVNTTEFQKLKQTIKDDDELINIQKDIIANKNEKIVGQESYISELEEIMENYKQNIDAIEKEFVELKNSINNQNNLYIKPNSKKIKVLGIPLYSVEY